MNNLLKGLYILSVATRSGGLGEFVDGVIKGVLLYIILMPFSYFVTVLICGYFDCSSFGKLVIPLIGAIALPLFGFWAIIIVYKLIKTILSLFIIVLQTIVTLWDCFVKFIGFKKR